MRSHSKCSVAPIAVLLLLVLTSCSTLRPTAEVRHEFLQDARFTLEQDGVALLGRPPPSLDDLRSGQNPELIHRLVGQLDGPDSVSSEMLLSASAVLDGKRLTANLCSAFDRVTNRLAVDDLNLIIMKAAAVKS